MSRNNRFCRPCAHRMYWKTPQAQGACWRCDTFICFNARHLHSLMRVKFSAASYYVFACIFQHIIRGAGIRQQTSALVVTATIPRRLQVNKWCKTRPTVDLCDRFPSIWSKPLCYIAYLIFEVFSLFFLSGQSSPDPRNGNIRIVAFMSISLKIAAYSASTELSFILVQFTIRRKFGNSGQVMFLVCFYQAISGGEDLQQWQVSRWRRKWQTKINWCKCRKKSHACVQK